MSSWRLAVLLSTSLLVLGMPSPAHANKWWGWLEELSGPGPFHGTVLLGEIGCSGELLTFERKRMLEELLKWKANIADALSSEEIVRRIDQARLCRYDRRNVRYAVVVEGGRWSSDPNENFEGAFRLITAQTVLYTPLRRWDRDGDNRVLRAVEIGAGLGAYRLTGSGVGEDDREFWRGSVPFRVRLILSELLMDDDWLARRSLQTRRVLHALQFRFGYDFLPGLLNPSEFRVSPGRDPGASSNEWLKTYGFTVDLGAIFWASKPAPHEKHVRPTSTTP